MNNDCTFSNISNTSTQLDDLTGVCHEEQDDEHDTSVTKTHVNHTIHSQSLNTDCDNMVTQVIGNDVIVIENSLGHLDLHVYRRRWVILVLYSLSTSLQAALWNQWGPIAAVSERVYGWTDGVIALFGNWGPITYIPTALLWSWLLDTKGLRVACVSAAGLIAVGSGLRCLVTSPPAFTWLVHICHILNGLSGPVAMGAVPKISAVWFPPEERATATAISFAMAVTGFSLTFLIGPLVVSEVTFDGNCTSTNRSTGGQHPVTNTTLPCEADVLETQRDEIMYYMYGTFAVCAALFLAMLVYFPDHPPKPPSPSASTPRLDYLSGLKQLFRKWRFWQIGVAYGVSTGVRDSWSSMLDVNLKSHGISQSEAGWLGFYGTIAGAAAGILAGRFADRFQTRLRMFLLLLNILTIASFLWLVLQIMAYIPEWKVTMYVAYILAAFTGFVVSPLFYELVCETAYPVSEGIANICLTTLNQTAILVFLGILSIPSTGTEWMNWLLVSSFALAIILLILLPDGHNRLDIDMKGDSALKEDHNSVTASRKHVKIKDDGRDCSNIEMTTHSDEDQPHSGITWTEK